MRKNKFSITSGIFVCLITSVSSSAIANPEKFFQKLLTSGSARAWMLSNKKRVHYMGPSNTIGLGSVWTIADDGTLTYQWGLDDICNPPPPAASEFEIAGAQVEKIYARSGTRAEQFKLSLSLVSAFLGGDLSSKVSKAGNVEITGTYSVARLKAGPLVQFMESTAAGNASRTAYKTTLLKRNAYAVTTMIVLKSFTLKYSLDVKGDRELGTKYDHGAKFDVGTVSHDSSKRQVAISVDRPVALYLGFGQYSPATVAGSGGGGFTDVGGGGTFGFTYEVPATIRDAFPPIKKVVTKKE